MTKTLLFSRDPGGTNQLVALNELIENQRRQDQSPPDALPGKLHELFATDNEIIIGAKDYAQNVWRIEKITPLGWQELIEPVGNDDALAQCKYVITHSGVSRIVTATSDTDDQTEQYFWQAAKELSVESWCIVDHAVNIPIRFRRDDGSTIMPDFIFVTHERAKTKLLDDGFAAEIIQVIPDLHLRRMSQRRHAVPQSTINNIREQWSAKANDHVILFPSENGREMAHAGRKSPYDEVKELTSIIIRLCSGEDIPGFPGRATASTILVIRPHPKDTPEKYTALADSCELRIIISNDGTALEVILAADSILGLDSSMLFEARILGKPAYSSYAGSEFNALVSAKTTHGKSVSKA